MIFHRFPTFSRSWLCCPQTASAFWQMVGMRARRWLRYDPSSFSLYIHSYSTWLVWSHFQTGRACRLGEAGCGLLDCAWNVVFFFSFKNLGVKNSDLGQHVVKAASSTGWHLILTPCGPKFSPFAPQVVKRLSWTTQCWPYDKSQ